VVAAEPVPRYCQPMSDMPPDRLSADPMSPYYDAALLERGVGVRFKGVDRNNVEEYCVSEGWVRLSVGNTRDRKGRPLAIKLTGEVEPYFRDQTDKA
jgi:hypothetical protein